VDDNVGHIVAFEGDGLEEGGGLDRDTMALVGADKPVRWLGVLGVWSRLYGGVGFEGEALFGVICGCRLDVFECCLDGF
jgi:hypothetical protein